MIPEVKKTKDDACDCPSFLTGDTFQAIEQEKGTQASHSSLAKLQRQRPEFWESEEAMFIGLSTREEADKQKKRSRNLHKVLFESFVAY